METVGLTGLFGGAYAGRRVLVTGHTGFKGSWLALWLRTMGAQVGGFSLAPDTTPSHWTSLDLELVDETIADISDARAIAQSVQRFRPELVLHLAAQPLVRRSYREPARTFEVNVGGLVNLLEAVRACPGVRGVVNVTTDKVYEPPCPEHGYSETHALGGHDPYSASKACSDIVAASYRRSFFGDPAQGAQIGIVNARAGNVIGGGDWAEDRLVPDLVRAIDQGASLSIRHPASIRPWQHVLEPLSGYLALGQALLEGRPLAPAWNFGPAQGEALPVMEVVRRFQRHWPELQVQTDDGRHPHEAGVLKLDSREAFRQLDWRPVWTAGQAIDRTAGWYRSFLDGNRHQSLQDLAAYVADARTTGLEWARA